MSLISEFKTFLQRGNAIDMAMGTILGGAFGKIVSSLVADLQRLTEIRDLLAKRGA